MGDHHEPPNDRVTAWVSGLTLLLLVGGAMAWALLSIYV